MVMTGLRELKKEEKKERLLQESIELFTKKGFEQTSIEDITSRAGVAKGTFYNFFTKKEDVLLYYLDKELVQSRYEIELKIERMETIVDRLELLIFTYLKYIFRNKDFAKILVRERVFKIGTGKNWNETLLLQTIRQQLESAREKGEIRHSVDLDSLTELIFAIFTMYTIYWLNGMIKTKKQCVEQVRSVLRLCFDGAGTAAE
jgi:AcrR family transcriptional regulator